MTIDMNEKMLSDKREIEAKIINLINPYNFNKIIKFLSGTLDAMNINGEELLQAFSKSQYTYTEREEPTNYQLSTIIRDAYNVDGEARSQKAIDATKALSKFLQPDTRQEDDPRINAFPALIRNEEFISFSIKVLAAIPGILHTEDFLYSKLTNISDPNAWFGGEKEGLDGAIDALTINIDEFLNAFRDLSPTIASQIRMNLPEITEIVSPTVSDAGPSNMLPQFSKTISDTLSLLRKSPVEKTDKQAANRDERKVVEALFLSLRAGNLMLEYYQAYPEAFQESEIRDLTDTIKLLDNEYMSLQHPVPHQELISKDDYTRILILIATIQDRIDVINAPEKSPQQATADKQGHLSEILGWINLLDEKLKSSKDFIADKTNVKKIRYSND